jgi:CRP/FNR family transcriptional regulator, cyclic AMP receptor protein
LYGNARKPRQLGVEEADVNSWRELLRGAWRRDPKLRLVSSLPLFAGVRPSRLRRLARGLDEAGFAAGDVLMRQGSYHHSLYILLDGEVEVGDERPCSRTLGPGLWFGEGAMLDRSPATATAVARTSGRALVMGHDQFRSLKAHPDLVRRLIARDWGLAAPA